MYVCVDTADRLSNQIAGKVTAASMFLRYVADGLFRDIEYLISKRVHGIDPCNPLTLLVLSLQSRLFEKHPFNLIHNGFQVQHAGLVRCRGSGGGSHRRYATLNQHSHTQRPIAKNETITGGSGLGLILAQALESNGAKVYITGRNEEKLQAAAKTAVRPPSPSGLE